MSRGRERFEQLALPLMDVLYGGALKLTRNARDAEDLLQDTYVRALERFHLFKPGTNLKAWMFRVMTNRFINLYRRRRAQPDRTRLEDAGEFQGGDGRMLQDFQSAQALAQLMRNPAFLDSLDDRLKRALQDLGEDYRTVLILNVIGGLQYKEIAQELDLPLGTVMSRLSRARGILRERVAELAIEEIGLSREDAALAAGAKRQP